ncbi:NAD(P)-dependent oxidoreductase [Pseudolysinimonas sp.]|uniref:NAD(P)-dependent oxidoreductase n=1 Tax=Pseudolysinimonas sp. TaxID=2680009 RepID=UPI003F7F98EB
MTRITVIGGTGYAGSAIVAEAAARGHEVTSFSRTLPETSLAGVTYVQGDATDDAALASAVEGTEVVVGALSPRGATAGKVRPAYHRLAELVAAAGARLVVVGGWSSLRPAAGAPRFSADADAIPEMFRAEALEIAAIVDEDLPATPAELDWLFVSPAQNYGSYAPFERTGSFRVGDDVALTAEGGTRISGPDFGLAVVELIERDEHHRTQVNVAE